MPKVPNTDLAAQIAQLRCELDALRDELFEMSTEVRTHRLIIDDHEGNELAIVDATEVRTRSLVVVDEYGAERITTDVTDNHTWIRVGISTTEDEAGFGCLTDADVLIAADLGEGERSEGLEACRGSVTCSTGDNSYAILEQTQLVGKGAGSQRVAERGSLTLYQQVSWLNSDGPKPAREHRYVQLDHNGVTETSSDDGLVAFAPMQKA